MADYIREVHIYFPESKQMLPKTEFVGRWTGKDLQTALTFLQKGYTQHQRNQRLKGDLTNARPNPASEPGSSSSTAGHEQQASGSVDKDGSEA